MGRWSKPPPKLTSGFENDEFESNYRSDYGAMLLNRYLCAQMCGDEDHFRLLATQLDAFSQLQCNICFKGLLYLNYVNMPVPPPPRKHTPVPTGKRLHKQGDARLAAVQTSINETCGI